MLYFDNNKNTVNSWTWMVLCVKHCLVDSYTRH